VGVESNIEINDTRGGLKLGLHDGLLIYL